MDNVTYQNNGSVSSVPEPDSFVLMAAGLLAGLIYVSVRRFIAPLVKVRL
jgi:hypothetical protein